MLTLIKRKQGWLAMLISNNVDFRVKYITRDREGHFIMIKWATHQEDITILNKQTNK